jgi:hypothetical protein
MTGQFSIPSTEQFAAWPDSERPAAVVRILCNEHHPILERWRSVTGDDSTWIGRMADGSGVAAAEDQAVGPAARDGEWYWRRAINCQECDYRRVLTPAGQAPVERLLEALLDGELPAGALFDHPSKAPAFAVSADHLFGYRQRV